MAQWITFLIFGGLGVMLLYVGVTQFLQQRRNMRDARPIEATVVHSQIVSHTSADTDSRLGRSTSTTTHRPDVRFRYQVLGREYESDRLYPNIIVTSYASTESAAEVLKPFPLHATVRAYVDPSHPEQAFLIRESGNGPVVFMVLGVLLPPLAWVIGGYV